MLAEESASRGERPSNAAAAVDHAARTLTLALAQEPPQLDSTKSTDSVSIRILGHVMEGLLRYNRNNELVPGVAESYELRERGATFHLRPDARWSDGEPVTAQDFVFAWPTAYFDKLVAFPTYYPVREDFYHAQGERYAADPENLLYNGPFVIDEWIHGASLRMEKNEDYWDAESIWLETIDHAYITNDTNAVLNLFKDEKIALAALNSETMDNALEQKWRIRSFNNGAVFYIGFNHREDRPTRNEHLRRAMHLVFDPHEFVNRVIGIPGNLPGRSLFPVWLKGAEKRLRLEQPAPEHDVDVQAARRHLSRAREQLGVQEIPPLVLLVGDSDTAGKQAEYLQRLWGDTLGLEIRIDQQIFKQRLAKMTAGTYDLVGAGWGPDYDDPLTFGDLFASWNLNNRGRYENPELDRWVRVAQNALDPHRRSHAFGEIQRILYEDTVIIPQLESTSLYVVHPDLESITRRAVGFDPDFTRARIRE